MRKGSDEKTEERFSSKDVSLPAIARSFASQVTCT